MADNLFNVGTRLSASDYLQLISFMNKREMDDNRMIRGLGTLTGVSTSDLPSSGLETSLRRYSTANDEEITGKIIYGMADGDYKSEKEYVREYKRRNYPPLFMEKALAEWRRTKGREESAASAGYAADRAAQADLMDPLNLESKQQAIDKEARRIQDVDVDEAMIGVVKRAAEDDIKAIAGGEKYHAVVRKRLGRKGSAGWDKNHTEYYKSLMAMADQKPKATATTKAVYDTRNGELRWLDEDTIKSINSAEGEGTILPAAEKPVDDQQVSLSVSGSAAQILGDPAILAEVGLDYETAALLLEEWSKDKSWLVRFTEIAQEHRKLYTKWRDTANEISRWWITPSTDSVEGKVLD